MNSINFFSKKTNKMHTYVQKIVSFFNSHPLIKFAVKLLLKQLLKYLFFIIFKETYIVKATVSVIIFMFMQISTARFLPL